MWSYYGHLPFWILIFKFWYLSVITFRSCNASPYKISQKSDNLLPSYHQKQWFQYIVHPPSWILKYEFWSHHSYQSHYLIQSTKSYHNRTIFSLRYADIDFLISGRPPSWICDDVIKLYAVVHFHGPLSLSLSCIFKLIGLTSYKPHICAIGDRQTDGHRHRLKLPSRPLSEAGGLIKPRYSAPQSVAVNWTQVRERTDRIIALPVSAISPQRSSVQSGHVV